jgi:FAD/FMN-containing dehydrogenase
VDRTFTHRTPDFSTLRERLRGDLVVPGDVGWDAARQPWNLAAQQHPVAVALAETADDVVAVVDFAREGGLQVAPQGTGHSAGALGDLDGTILLKTERMRRVEVYTETRTARVEAGVLWEEVAAAAGDHGLAVLAGSSPNVGVVGYTLGGGMSWLARQHGLAANNVEAAELVTGEGRLVRADRDVEPDLFWALRGGGGNFGVVTALEFALFPIDEVYAGWLIWPMERAAEVLKAWRRWTRELPEELTSFGRLLHVPPLPDIPEPFRGRSLVGVEAASTGARDDADRLLESLRELGPEMDTFAVMPPRELAKVHMDPEDPTPVIGDGMLLDDLPDATIDDLVAAVGVGSGSPLVSIEIRHLGGALARARPDSGPLATLDAEFAVFSLGVPIEGDMAAAINRAVDRVEQAFAGCKCGRYFNFTERRVDGSALFPAEAYERLRQVKAQYDPQNVIRANHPILPAA